jgi:quercetin dioxygenase-like cupin family protein
VYVVEGTYELGIDDQPTKIYKAGETFQEPSGCLHRVSRNPSSSGNTRLIALVLHPRDAKDIVMPEQH